MMLKSLATAVLSAATLAAANPASKCVNNDICYQVGVPTSVASAGSGDIYYQMQAPTTYSWVAMGQGDQMAGASIFVLYSDGRGNVTVSPRSGRGHIEPRFDSNVQVQLLAGSGISTDGKTMVANFKCTNCQRWSAGSMSLTSTGADYIGAWSQGSPINSASTSADIVQHDSHAAWQFDLTKATIQTNSNPYVEGSSGSTGPSTGGVSSGPPSGSSNSGSSDVSGGKNIPMLITAHGVIMAIVMVFLYPLGSLLMPLVGHWMVHGGVQIIAFILMWAGFAIGYMLSQDLRIGFSVSHTLFGTIIVALFGIQPFLGFAHHKYYKKNLQRSIISHVHIWYGRIIMVLGVINGGLGLQLTNADRSFVIAYSVIAAVLFAAYAGAKAFGTMRKRKSGAVQNSGRRMEEQRHKNQAAHGSPGGSISR